jgi:regulator of protease activity HflC (stomatin/prohibitin superfamily)
MVAVIVIIIVALIVFVTLARTIRVVPQARAAVVERLGRYSRTLSPGLTLVVPFIDRIRSTIDLREQVVSFPPQPVITEDNLVVSIDSVIYFQVTDPKSATYEIANYIQAIEQLTVTTLRNVIGGMDAREDAHLARRRSTPAARRARRRDRQVGHPRQPRRAEGDRPAASIQDSMEKQMRADRDKRAAILQAEGAAAVADPQAEGEKQCAILQAEGKQQATVLEAEGQAKAIETVFGAIHEGKPDAELLAYQYLQTLPLIAQGESNKVWIIPSELQSAVGRVAGAVKDLASSPPAVTERTEAGVGSAPLAQRTSAVGDKRQQLLGAAVRVFARKGFHASRVGDIAEEAGVAHGLLYHYFNSKDEVLEAVFHDNWSLLLARIASVEETDEPAADQLRHITAIVLRTWLHLPDVVRVVIREFGRRPGAGRADR